MLHSGRTHLIAVSVSFSPTPAPIEAKGNFAKEIYVGTYLLVPHENFYLELEQRVGCIADDDSDGDDDVEYKVCDVSTCSASIVTPVLVKF